MKAEYSAIQSQILGIGAAAEATSTKLDALSKDDALRLRLRMNNTKAGLAEITAAETAAARGQESLAASNLAFNIRATRQRIAEEARAAAEIEAVRTRAAAQESALAASTLAFNMRMTAQRAKEAAAAEKSIVKVVEEGAVAQIAAHARVGSSALRFREIFVLIREAIRGDFSRMAGSVSILAQTLNSPIEGMNLLRFAVTPLGLAVLALTAIVGGVVVAMYQGGKAAADLANSMVITGNYAGVTSDRISSMAKSIQASTGESILGIQGNLAALTATGKFTSDEMFLATDIATRFAQFTGQSADKIVGKFEELKGGVVKFAVKWEEAYHDLTLAQIDHIAALEKAGKHHEAELAFFNDVDKDIHTKAAPAYGYLQAQLHLVTTAAQNMWAALMNWGAPQSLDSRIIAAAASVQESAKGLNVAFPIAANPTERAQIMDQRRAKLQSDLRDMNALTAQQAAIQAKAAADAKKAQDEDDAIRKKYDNPGHGHTPSLAGAEDSIATLKAQVKGLQDQINSVSADPLSEIAAKIQKAGEVEAARRTAGTGAGFADEARRLGEAKEELTIRLALLETSVKNTRQSALETAQASLEAAGRQQAQEALQGYYRTARDSYSGLVAAQEAGIDAQTRAKAVQENYTIAQRYGVTSVDQIADAYVRASKGTDAAGVALQLAAQDELDAAKARDQNSASIQKETARTDALTQALAAEHQMREQLAQLVESSGLTFDQREVDQAARVYQLALLTRAQKGEIAALTNDEALAQGRMLALLDKTIADEAKLKTGIKDSIRQAFIESGKLDFTSLKEGVLQALRKAIYTAFLEKPIDILVNAVVNFETKAIDDLLNSFGGRGGSADAITEGLKSLGVQSATVTNGLNGAAATFSKVATKFSSLIGPIALAAIGGGIIGGGLTKLLGGDAKQQKVGSTVGSFLGGIPGAIIGLLSGKESNHGAIAGFNSAGQFVGVTGDKRNADTTAAVTTIAQGVASEIANLKQLGINAAGVIKEIDLGTRDPTHIRLNNGQNIDTALGDAAALQDAIERALLKGATYANAQEQKLVDQMLAANASLDEISTALQGFVQAQTDFQSVTLGLLKYTDPTAYATQSLQVQQLARRKTLKDEIASGFFTQAQITQLAATLPQLEQREIQDALANVAGSANDAAHSLADFVTEQQKIADFVRSLSVGALSPLSPADQLAAQRTAYQTQLASARGGNFTALQGITGTAQTYLEQAQKFFGSGSAYAAVFTDVTSALNDLSAANLAQDNPVSDAVNAASEALQAAIAAGSLSIVDAISVANDVGSGGGVGASNNNGALTQAQIDQITAAIANQTEAMAGVNSNGLQSIAGSLGDAATLNVLSSGGGLAA